MRKKLRQIQMFSVHARKIQFCVFHSDGITKTRGKTNLWMRKFKMKFSLICEIIASSTPDGVGCWLLDNIHSTGNMKIYEFIF